MNIYFYFKKFIYIKSNFCKLVVDTFYGIAWYL